jgi:Zn-dependent protease with chaperone function
MAAVMGFGGALVNLFISKRSAKRLYNIQLIDNTINDHKLRIVYSTIQDIAYTSKIEMPEV